MYSLLFTFFKGMGMANDLQKQGMGMVGDMQGQMNQQQDKFKKKV